MKSSQFYLEFYEFYKTLGQSVKFEPFYKYNTCQDCDYTEYVPGCVQNGKYCGAVNSALGIKDPLLILNENIRQKCIWYLNNNVNTLVYWDYMNKFNSLCKNPESPNFTEKCAIQVN